MESLYFSLDAINPLLQCFLCQGYLIDPYTIRECMHAFCRTCILVYFEQLAPSHYKCPKCKIGLQSSLDLSKCLAPDRQLGDLVRSFLPLLDVDEMTNEKAFYDDRSIAIPKDLQLKLRLAPQLTPMRYMDSQGRTRLCAEKAKSTLCPSSRQSPTSIAIQIELCRKFVDPSLSTNEYPKKYLCVGSHLVISHLRTYIESICQVNKSHRVHLFFYDSCLSDHTPLLLIKNLLFPTTSRIKLFFSIMSNK